MEKIRRYITPDVYSIEDLYRMGHDSIYISNYIYKRTNAWNFACQTFKEIFSSLGQIIIIKKYLNQKMTVVVYINDTEFKRLEHSDPLFALAEIARQLDNEDMFIESLFSKMTV